VIYLRAFTYGFVFFGIVAFIAFGGPPINQWVLKATIGNGLLVVLAVPVPILRPK